MKDGPADAGPFFGTSDLFRALFVPFRPMFVLVLSDEARQNATRAVAALRAARCDMTLGAAWDMGATIAVAVHDPIPQPEGSECTPALRAISATLVAELPALFERELVRKDLSHDDRNLREARDRREDGDRRAI